MLRKWKIPITGFYYGLLRFITDITEFYYGYYGTFLKDSIDSEPRPQKTPETLIVEKTLEKSSRFITDITEYYRYYGNRYYGILQNITVISPPPLLRSTTGVLPAFSQDDLMWSEAKAMRNKHSETGQGGGRKQKGQKQSFTYGRALSHVQSCF